jgi:hypothetical protein
MMRLACHAERRAETKGCTKMALLGGGLNAKVIGKYLERYGWAKYQVMSDTKTDTKILTGWREGADDEGHFMEIRIDHENHSLLFNVPQIASAKSDELSTSVLADVLTAISFANYSSVIGHFSYDVRDGEVRIEYAMPTDNSTVTYEQFEHVVNALKLMTDYWAGPVSDLCKGRRTSESVVDSFIKLVQGFGGAS